MKAFVSFGYVILCLGLIFDRSVARKHEPSRSMFKIDPGRLIPTMIKYGGLVLPKEVEDDLLVLDKVCSSDLTSLDVYNKELEVINFCVKLPGFGRSPALRIGRVFMKWNSYLNPCIELEVDDVDVLIEFTNLILTESNWSELGKEGFPPKMATEYVNPVSQQDLSLPPSASSSFIKIGGLDVEGSVRLKVVSRALGGKELCPDFVFEMKNLVELSDRIKYASEESFRKTGKKGCTTDELYQIIEEFFKVKLRKLMQSTLTDIARGALDPKYGGSKTIEETKRVFAGARSTFDKYTKNVADVTGKRVENKLANQLSRWGLSEEQIETVKKASKAAAETATSSLASAQAQLEQMKNSASEAGLRAAEEETENAMQKWGLNEEQSQWIKAGYKVNLEY